MRLTLTQDDGEVVGLWWLNEEEESAIDVGSYITTGLNTYDTQEDYEENSGETCQEVQHSGLILRGQQKLIFEALQLINANAPDGSGYLINGVPWIALKLVCNGMSPDMGYYCVLLPKHDGQCYSETKRLNFTPTNKEIAT